MADVRPFAALRPNAPLAPRICAPPYDVMSEAEARTRAARDELSFVHVSRPEVNFPAEAHPREDERHAAARTALARLIREGALRRDETPAFYCYRQEMAGHRQTGIVALASCADYVNGVILKHELTRVEKETDRMRHIEAVNAQTGPVFLFHEGSAALAEITRRVTGETPDLDFTAEDGVRHTTWRVGDADLNRQIRAAFAATPRLYVADGHHRSAAAVRVWEQRGRAPAAAGFLAVIFPAAELQILPYHRVLRDLNGHTPETVIERLGKTCEALPAGGAAPERRGEFGFYLEGRWRRFRFRPDSAASAAPADQLDVARLQHCVLEPLFGIENPRTSRRIDFVGGIRGIPALEAMVDSGAQACAFALHPTGIEELKEVADGGDIMPPKSTWFEPKLRDAVFCHLLE
jgi:uncharacterized protein (DUF1015 family)